MKTALALIAISATSFALAACGSDSADNASESASTTSAAPTVTTEATPAQDAEASPTQGTPITITAGDSTITATLNDSQVAQDFAKMLPIDLTWFRNAGIEYITELNAPLTETGPFYTAVQAGDIVYYNPRDSITIIYAPTSSVPTLTKMGEVTSDLSVFQGLPDNTEMRIERG